MKGIKFFLCASLLLVFSIATNALPQDFPSKPIRLIVPYAAGGGTDVLARTLQHPMGQELGTTIVVENISGGSTKIGTLQLIDSKPDGYTLLLVGPEVYVGYYHTRAYDFKAWQKMTIIGNTGEEPYGFIEVKTDSPFQTWQELTDYAKRNPGKLTCGGPAAGGMLNLIANDIAKKAGIEIKFVPFAGSGPANNALLGGHVDLRLCGPSEAITMIRAGKTKGLAVSSDDRLKELPDVPTFKELQIGQSVNISKAIFGPPKLPQNIVKLIAKALEKTVQSPAFIKYCEHVLYIPKFKDGQLTLEETNKFDEKWGPHFEAFYKEQNK